MRQVYVGVYHKDKNYGCRLMEYLNHQKDYPMTAWFTSDYEKFMLREKEDYFGCVVLPEEISYDGDLPVCSMEIMGKDGRKHHQSALEIAREIYGVLQVNPDEQPKVLGVYSPLGRQETTQISITAAREKHLIYIGMTPYNGFSVSGEATDELLFYIKERRINCVEYFQSHQEYFQECHGYPPAGCYLDYREPSMEDYQWFFDSLRKEQFSVIVDMGAACPPYLHFFCLFDKVYIPLFPGEHQSEVYHHFRKQLEKYHVWKPGIIEELLIGKNHSIKEVVKRL